jgi:hypothetical protein
MFFMRNLYLLLCLFFLSSLSSFSQMKIDENTPVTDGKAMYLKYPEATITPPKGYLYLDKYSSFVNHTTGTSISVVKKKGASYKSMIEHILHKENTISNAKMLSNEEHSGGVMFVFQFVMHDKKVERIMYITGDENDAYYVMANYKQEDKEKYFSLLKRSVLSIQF